MWSCSGLALHRSRSAARPTPPRPKPLVRWAGPALAILAVLSAASPPAAAADGAREVDLELVLAIDVSRSVDEEEARLQRDGYIAAFRHPSVIEAIRRGPLGRVAVSYFEWGDYGNTHLVVDWTMIGDRASALAFADELGRTMPMSARRTGISGAIDYGVSLFDRNRFDGRRRVIDVSGDGANNSGELVTVARDRAVAAGVTINGLPILNDRDSPGGWPQVPNLDLYFRDCVIGGPGAFYLVAKDFRDFGRAVLRKLILEIADARPADADQPRRAAGHPLLVLVATEKKTPPPCDAGERRRRQLWFGDDPDNYLQPPPMRPRQSP